MTTYRCLLVYVPSNEETIEKVKNFLWEKADALIKDLGDCERSPQPSGRASADEPPAISAKITIQGRVKSIAADTPDELLHKLSRVLAKEGIDVWAILTKPRKQ